MTRRVDLRATASVLGTVLKYVALAMLVPLVVALVYREDILVFAGTITGMVALGIGLEQIEEDPDFGPPEALLLVTLAWVSLSFLGAIPYIWSTAGTDSSLAHPVNALFESTSGFTTTGATVMNEIGTDRYSHALLIWRQLTQWLGGMGIIVLMVAILPELGVNGAQLIRTEAPGPELQKLTPRIAETARVLWLVYFGFTILLIGLLTVLHHAGLAANMDLFNAVAHGLSTLPTGGFSPEADSIAAFSAPVQWTIVPFMLVAGTNFALFWHLLGGDVRAMVGDPEFRAYLGMIALLTASLAVVLFRGAADAATVELGHVPAGAITDSLRQATFQIGSIMNSTGFATSDFAAWEPQGQIILLLAMFVGGSAGSTGGGIKVIRWLVVLKAARRELVETGRPDAVEPVRLGEVVINEQVVRSILAFTVLYIVLFGGAAVFFMLDGMRVGYELTVLEAMSASIATLGNIGPGFGSLGPFGSYLQFPWESKLLMVVLMWLGRLEIVPMLALVTRMFWQSS